MPDVCDDVDLNGFQRTQCSPNLVETARNTSELSLFVEFIEAAGLDGLLECAGPFTILAPVNDAIEALGKSAIEELMNPGNKGILRELLLYHILGQDVSAEDLREGEIDTLLDGAKIFVGIDPLQLNDASIVRSDEGACNGIIQVIDDVLMPKVNGKMNVAYGREGLTNLKNNR